MVDLSYSAKFAALGNHFNRSLIEAYNGGCVPLVCEQNMTEQLKPIFAGAYVAVSMDERLSALAIAIDNAVCMGKAKRGDIVGTGREVLLRHFHYLKSAQNFIGVGKGSTRAGIYGKLERGVLNAEIKAASRKVIKESQHV
jgi:hypothetical protein